MTLTMVPQSTNGAKPASEWPGEPHGRVLVSMAPQVDRLMELRERIQQDQETERRLSDQLRVCMAATGRTRLEGRRAVVVLDQQTARKIDPALLHMTLGPRAFDAMTVDVTAVLRHLDEADLVPISETIAAPELRVERIA